MTDDEMQHIAELHFDGDPEVLAELRNDPEVARILRALDRVVAELAKVRKPVPPTEPAEMATSR